MLSTLPQERPQVRFPVLTLPRLELCFRCGNRLWLRQVDSDPLMRVIEQNGIEPIPVDLRRLMPELSTEVQQAAPLDRAAVIFFNLRLRYRTQEAFLNAATAH